MVIRNRLPLEAPSQPCRPALSVDHLPFSAGDLTAGSEDELQAVVLGRAESCDLPMTIRGSRFFANIARRSASGESPRKTFVELQEFLSDTGNVWENSWIRFPEHKLSLHALDIFHSDLGLNRWRNATRRRSDSPRYIVQQGGERWVRVPISYALKLALADLVGAQPHMPEAMRREAERLLGRFSNDNSSPETTSFHLVTPELGRDSGRQIARESARRFLFTSLLMSWANQRFGLEENGQRGMVYHAPHPPVRQTELSSCISDSFYRELFMSPCLSGWDDGEAKADYMHLCHQVLSRSQLNSVAKLREAGIIANNLVVLPTMSNVSLANNGIHISMGSRLLTEAAKNSRPDASFAEEKRTGDLVIKIFEHFLPLFVGTYSAAPYRIDFAQFHPEKLLSFLPHELDFTHLRLMWREWKEKAKLRIFGHPATPYGPAWLDNFVAGLFRLRGDVVPDYRLINYPVAWLSTEETSALDGTPGNIARLASELDELGIVDRRLSFYMPLRLREFRQLGFSGFEGRYYSLFPSYSGDMAPAASLQQLLLMAAYYLAASGFIRSEQIPDDPSSESERRQPFFFAAAGLPAFYVHKNSRNQLLGIMLRQCRNIRSSWRHMEYLRVSIRDYRQALLSFLEAAAKPALEGFGDPNPLAELRTRLEDGDSHAATRLSQDMLSNTSHSDPLQMNAREFNQEAERYYREDLRSAQLREAFQFLREDADSLQRSCDEELRSLIRCGVRVQDPVRFLGTITDRVVRDGLSVAEIASVLNLLLLLTSRDERRSKGFGVQ